MLAVVKTPHIEMTLSGEGLQEFIQYIRAKYPIEIFHPLKEVSEEAIELKTTDWWKQNAFRVLAGYRRKAGLTQQELAEKSGIPQSVISLYERGKRLMTRNAAEKLAPVLAVVPEKLII